MPDYRSPGVYVEEVPSSVKAIAGVSTSTPGFIGIVPDKINLVAKQDDDPTKTKTVEFSIAVPAKTAKLITSWTQFTTLFGDLLMAEIPAPGAGGAGAGGAGAGGAGAGGADATTPPPNLKQLGHAVYGFFNNGGSRCYVSRITSSTDLRAALKAFEAVDEIALVAVPGATDSTTYSDLTTHCKATGDRFAIFDGPATADVGSFPKPSRSDLAACYFPWIKVFDPALKLKQVEAKGAVQDGLVEVPLSGHVAGVYARVDAERGVHKAPANEVILGALDVTQPISSIDQRGLNDDGINCIRVLNGNILVWGARTVGGNANADLKYINVRRTLLYLRESIDEGTQWAVFEPNTPALWQKINRNVSAFLTNVWRSGALFGNTPQEAFYVKCDAENNPPELRELGQVVTEIGVAIVRPAEFVIFRLSQMVQVK
jgi:phage tail sheath protein FI